MSRPYRLTQFGAAATLAAAISLMVIQTASAVDGGYGPVSGEEGGVGGTFNDVIVSETVGPGGGTLHGHHGSTAIDLTIPPGEFNQPEQVDIATSRESVEHPKGEAVLLISGIRVHQNEGSNFDPGLQRSALWVFSNKSITEAYHVYTLTDNGRWIALPTATVEVGHVSLFARGAPIILITSPSYHYRNSSLNRSQADKEARRRH